MNKLVVLSTVAALIAAPAFANEMKKEAAPAAPAAAAPAAAAPAAGAAVQKLELNNGIWVEAKDWNVGTEVKASKDGKSWMAAPDGTHISKDGKVAITTKGGKVEKVETKG